MCLLLVYDGLIIIILIQMSKWNKTPAQQLTPEFIQNEQRRKQMIIQAAKRRKQKQRRLLQQQQLKRKDEEEALVRHKQEKKDAYVKYLRNNIYDKYEDVKRKKKQASSEIKPTAKWKKRTPEKQELKQDETPMDENHQQLEALDLQVNMDLGKGLLSVFDERIVNESGGGSLSRKKLNEQFERQWQQQLDAKQDLLNSKLLDSLDLDVGTLNRDFQMKQLIKQKNKTIQPKLQQRNDEIRQLRDLIGYESVVIHPHPKMQQKEKNPPVKPSKPPVAQKQSNEVQVLNQLKHKKQAKVLNWAIQQQQQAEDLFSECSSVTRKKQPKALKQLNQELKNKKTTVVNNNKKALQTIKEVARQKIASRERKTSSNDAPKQPQRSNKNQRPFQNSKQKEEKPERINSKSMQKRANTTTVSNPTFTKKQPKNQVAKTTTSGFASDKNVTRVKTTSKQKKQPQQKQPPLKPEPPKSIPKAQPSKKLFGNLPPLPAARVQNNSIATHDMQIDVQSFIKQDLINLNEREWELQEELRQLHKDRRGDLNEIYSKYGIRTDYKHSSELTGQARQGEAKYYQSEADIEESLQNLQNLEIRRNIQSREHIREATNQSSDSIINPFSSSEVLCNQVLKLAKNIERFDRRPAVEDPNGYGHMNKMKRNNSGNKGSQVSRMTKDSKKQRQRLKQKQKEEDLSQSQQISELRQMPLSRPPFIFDASEVSSKLRGEQPPVQRIHVNRHLLKGLIDDD